MMNRNRKGFTIVELVIVIAVIAILAAVLIPTFASIIRKANISADTQLAKTLNTALTVENVDNDIDDIYEVIDALNAQGFILANLNAKANECYYAWEKDTNQIVLVDGKEGYKVIFALNEEYGAIDDSWYFVINDAELAAKVKADYATANVLSFFETPSAAEIAAPMTNIANLYNNTTEDKVADSSFYVTINTNGAKVSEIKIGDTTYSSTDTFKLSVGQNKFIEFNYFTVAEDGTVALAAPIVAFDAEAKYGVVGEALVMTTGTALANQYTESAVYVKTSTGSVKAEKNAKGQYEIRLKAGEKNSVLTVTLPEVTTADQIIRKSNTGFGYTACDDLTAYGGTGVGYMTYLYSYGKEIPASYTGTVKTYTLYVIGKGYVNFEIVYIVE